MTSMTMGRMQQESSPVKFIATMIALVVFIIVGLTVFFGSWYTVDQTERAVLLRNGAYVETVQPGLHLKAPWIESVYKIDMKTHTHIYGQDKATGKDIMEAYSKDQQPAYLRVSVTVRVDPKETADVYTRFGGDLDAAVSRMIQPQVYARTKVVFGQYTAARAISERGALNSEVGQAIKDSIKYDPMFIVENVQIENISFSPEYIKSIEQRMQAEVEVQRLQQNLAREKVQADIAVTQANGRANSVRAEAQAQADATVLRGNAEATAIKAKAEALATNSNLIMLTQAERWNGALPSTMVPGGAVPFVSVK
jgi:regulator of protease activity HflC (stomatin/prohibitin superfamily)